MSREVHKFGGASVKDADGVRNVGRILGEVAATGVEPAVVVSAMGKTTNALEAVWTGLSGGGTVGDHVASVREFHEGILLDLGLAWDVLHADWDHFVRAAQLQLGAPANDRGYDALVGFGERFSTRIVHAHLDSIGINARWLSAWELILTDQQHRAARVALRETGDRIRAAVGPEGSGLALTQGFVGGTAQGVPTTLGREGSDFSGALMAEALGADRFVVWKDVPAVMTGDPRHWPCAEPLTRLDYGTAERMSAAGAGVLHPATMAPLRRAGIPLDVRSFLDSEATGTTVSGDVPPVDLPPLWAFTTDGDGATCIRCLTGHPEAAVADWTRAYPARTPAVPVPDAVIPGCYVMRPGD